MPVVGNRKETNNKGYMKDPLYKYCKQYLETVEGILTESKSKKYLFVLESQIASS